MKNLIKKYIQYILQLFLLLIRKKNIVILSSINSISYKTNTRYLFEYLSKNLQNFDIYYVTECKDIKEYFISKNLKYISKTNILKYIYISASAKIVINSGDAYHNPFNITDFKNITKICTMHGNSPKTKLPKNTDPKYTGYQKFDYVCFNNEYLRDIIGIDNFKLDESKILTLGSPQCDQFYQKKYLHDRMNTKKISKLLNMNFPNDGKTVLYTPTWRPYEYPNPLTKLDNFSWDKFNVFLSKENIFFYYSFHSINTYPNNIYESSNIKFIDDFKYRLYDTNHFMCEVDCLVNDYSNTHSDFSILQKPQIYVMPDYFDYNKEQGFLESYDQFIAGDVVKSLDELHQSISAAIYNPNYRKNYKKFESNLIDKYSSKNGNACHNYKIFIESNYD